VKQQCVKNETKIETFTIRKDVTAITQNPQHTLFYVPHIKLHAILFLIFSTQKILP